MRWPNYLVGPDSKRGRSAAPAGPQASQPNPVTRFISEALSLSPEEQLTAVGSALLSPSATGPTLTIPAALINALPQMRSNIAERSALNRETYAKPLRTPPAPPGVSIDADMREAARRRDPLGLYNRVKGHGPWDYKYRDKDTTKYEPFGNFAFGASGTALGLPPEILRRGAGAGQLAGDALKVLDQRINGRRGRPEARIKLEFGVPWGNYPYGDDPRDQKNIDQGIRYSKGRGY